MDDEEGEEDEDKLQHTLQVGLCWQQRRPHAVNAKFLAQDELFHTGEECIDRVAEAKHLQSKDSKSVFDENDRSLLLVETRSCGLMLMQMPVYSPV